MSNSSHSALLLRLSLNMRLNRWLSSDASAEEMQTALMELDSIGAVNVTFTMGTVACVPGCANCNAVLVTFLTEMGNLPDMRVGLSILLSLLLLLSLLTAIAARHC
jgi:hypothetical protein